MYLIVFLQGFVFYAPISTLYRQARGITIYDIFVIESVYWIIAILGEVPWGWFADRFGYKKTLVIANLIFFISKIVFYGAYSFPMFLLERVFLAIALSGLSGCDMAFLYSSIDEEESQKVFGRYSFCMTAGFLICSLMSTPIIAYSMDLAAFLTIIPYGLATIASLFLKEVKGEAEEKQNFKESFKRVLGNKNIFFLIVSVALITEVYQAITVVLNQPQYARSGIDVKYFGILLAAVQIIALASAKVHKITEKFGNHKSILGLILAMMISCLILVFTRNPILSVLSVMIVSGSMALIHPIVADVENKTIITQDRATILSIYAIIGDLVATVINPMIGKAADMSLDISFKFCVGLCVVAVILFLVYFRKEKGMVNETEDEVITNVKEDIVLDTGGEVILEDGITSDSKDETIADNPNN